MESVSSSHFGNTQNMRKNNFGRPGFSRGGMIGSNSISNDGNFSQRRTRQFPSNQPSEYDMNMNNPYGAPNPDPYGSSIQNNAGIRRKPSII